MKKIIASFIAGAVMATSISVYADEGLEKIEAYLRPSLAITLNGQKVAVESPPVMVDGSTYLKLRDAAKLTGTEVNWNETTQTVELKSSGNAVESTKPSQLPGSGGAVEETLTKEQQLYRLKAQISELKGTIQGATFSNAGAEMNLQKPDNPNREMLLKKIADNKTLIVDSERKITVLEAQIAQLEAQVGTP